MGYFGVFMGKSYYFLVDTDVKTAKKADASVNCWNIH